MYQFIPSGNLSEFPSYHISFPDNIEGGHQLGQKRGIEKMKND